MTQSFKYKFIISFVTVEIFFILCIVTINFFNINESTSKLIQRQIESTTLLTTELIKAPIAIYDLATLDNVVHTSSLKNVNSMIILDNQNIVLSQNYNLSMPIEDILKIQNDQILNINERKYNLKYMPVSYEDSKLGSIYIIFDMYEFTQLIKNNKTNTTFIVFLEIIVSTIIAYIVGTKLTNRLTNLSQTAQNIGQFKNDELYFPYQNEKNELGILARSLKQMHENIATRNIKLEKTKYIFDNIDEGIISCNQDGIITIINKSFYKHTLTTEENIIGSHIFQAINFIDKKQLLKITAQILKKNSWSGEIIIDTAEGIKYIKLNLVKASDINTTEFIAVINDITQDKKKQQVYQMQSKMAAMGEMIGNIAHQWRQPLNALSANILIVNKKYKKNLLDDEIMNNFKTKSSMLISKMDETINDFRNFFKPNKPKTTFNIYTSIQKVLQIVQASLHAHNIKIILECDESLEINSFPNELEQVLMVILNNSKDAINERSIVNPFIKISTQKIEEKIVLTILDNALGVDESIINKIFEPYFTTKHESVGTGIGLYMTKMIIEESMKGYLEVKNIDQGLQTTITLNIS
jgi:PAS domain S-box-containing protein